MKSLAAFTLIADLEDVLDPEATLTDRDAGADERPNHAVTESVGFDVRDEHALIVALPVEFEQGPDRRRLLAGLAIGGEVVESDERAGRSIHRRCVQVGADGGGAVPFERVVSRREVGDAVGVAPPHR